MRSNTVQCSNTGKVCPANTSCSADGQHCVTQPQVDACNELVDGDACVVLGGGTGTCMGGACIINPCGDGTLDQGEECDLGTDNSDTGACTTLCLAARCGDGLVWEGHETCEEPIANDNPGDGCEQCVATTWTPTLEIGGALGAKDTALVFPIGVAVNVRGDVYIAEFYGCRVVRWDRQSNLVFPVAGGDLCGFSGDGGQATAAQLSFPTDVAVDSFDNVYIVDAGNGRVRRIDAGTGVISTVAGGGDPADGLGDGGPAVAASLGVQFVGGPWAIALDNAGNLYISEQRHNTIRFVDAATGLISTIAGGGATSNLGDGGLATDASLGTPSGLAIYETASERYLYVASAKFDPAPPNPPATDTVADNRVRRVDLATGLITTIAGTGDRAVLQPRDVAVSSTGDVIAVEVANTRVVRADAGLTVLAGSFRTPGFAGDGGLATAALLAQPFAVAFDVADNLLIADLGNDRIRQIAAGTIDTAVGSGLDQKRADGLLATSVPLAFPTGVAIDPQGRVVVASTESDTIYRVEPTTQTITRLAGGNGRGNSGNGGPASAATIGRPWSVAYDTTGNLYVVDILDTSPPDDNSVGVRRIDANGIITAFAGGGTPADGVGDGLLATQARLASPTDIAFDSQSDAYIVDQDNSRIRRIDHVTGVISTYAGTTGGFSGDGGLATDAQLQYPRALAFDASDNLYVSDTYNNRVRRIDRVTKNITTIAGGASMDPLLYPIGLRFDPAGNLYVLDFITVPGLNVFASGRVRRIEIATGNLTTVAGGGTTDLPQSQPDFFGDGGAATDAVLSFPTHIVFDAAGDLYIADSGSNHIRRVHNGVIETIAGLTEAPRMGPFALAQLGDPQAVLAAGPFTLFAGGSTGTVQAIWTGSSHVETVAGYHAPQRRSFGDRAFYRGKLPDGALQSSPDVIGGIAYDESTQRIFVSETLRNQVSAITRVVPSDPHTWTIAPLPLAVRQPAGLYFDGAENALYVADRGNHVVRRLDMQSGTVTTVAGIVGKAGFAGDGGAATAARLNAPRAITRCGDALYISDTGNQRVRRVAANTISTIIGDGASSSAGGEGSPASAFPIATPQGLDCDAYGNVFVTSHNVVRELVADANHVVDGSGPVQTIYGAPGAPFPATATRCLSGLDVVDANTILLTDSCTGMFFELTRPPAQ